jgi:hypothetical protein
LFLTFRLFRKRAWRPSPFSGLDPPFPVEAHDFAAFETQRQLIAFRGKFRLFPSRIASELPYSTFSPGRFHEAGLGVR